MKNTTPVSFTCDYTEGAHPAILEALSATNLEQEPGYGEDRFCAQAREKIREALQMPQADVHLLVGGTQVNSTVIAALLRSYEGVVSVETGHIAVHETGAVEYTGHKVIPLPSHDGKMDARELDALMADFRADPKAATHSVSPGMVYISYPTELGTLYSRAEMQALHTVCKRYGIPLFVDGARLGYGLSSPACDLDFPAFARLCDAFTIGGTKVGALCGEAAVFPSGAPAFFSATVKQHGALLAKGRLLGIQFDALFTDGRYLSIARAAVEKALAMRKLFLDRGYALHVDSPTNQQFVLLDDAALAALAESGVLCDVWARRPDGKSLVRFVTSWATREEHIGRLAEALPPAK